MTSVDLAIGYSHLEQLRTAHNQLGHMDDPTWRLKQYKPTKRKVVKRITTAQRKLILPDTAELLTIKDSHVKFPGTGKWEDKLHHLYRLRKAVEPDSPESFVITDELAKIKQAPDAANLSDSLKFTFEDLQPPPDPNEDFTTYEYYNEQGSAITVTSGKIDVAGAYTGNNKIWCYKNFGVGTFADLEHLMEIEHGASGITDGRGCHWAVTNGYAKDMKAISTDADGAITIYGVDRLGVLGTYWYHNEFGEDYDRWSTSSNVPYFVTSDRIDDDSTSEWRITSHGGALQDTLILAGSATTFRYLYGFSGWDTGASTNWYGHTQDLDPQYTPLGNIRSYGIIME